MKKRHSLGFTLVELMMTLGVAAILMTVAVPGLQAFVQDSDQVLENNQLAAALRQARNEAIARNENVTLCKSDDQVSCAIDTAGWHEGWILFSDNDGDGALEADRGEQVLHALDAKGNSDITIQSAAFSDFISFRPDGGSNRSGQFVFCDAHRDSKPQALCVSRTGRWEISETDCYDGSELICS